MVLVLVVHTVANVSAKVPFAVVLLQDFVTNKEKVPKEFKCRQLVPTSGSTSASLWDVAADGGPDALLAWLNEHVNVECTHAQFEVQEDFAVGLGEVSRARAAERVAAAAHDAAESTKKHAADLDSRLKISETASAATASLRESAAVRKTGEVLSKAGASLQRTTTRVLESERVQSAAEATKAGLKTVGTGLSRGFASVTERLRPGSGAHAAGGDVAGPHANAPLGAGLNIDAPAAPPAPPAAPAAAPPPAAAPAAPAFTLDDGK